MYKRGFIIDDVYRTALHEKVKIHKEKIENEMLSNTDYIMTTLNDISKLLSEMNEATCEKKTLYREKTDYYRNDHEVVAENEYEIKKWVAEDADIIEIDKVVKEIENDIKFLEQVKDILKQKSWDMKNYIDAKKFFAGV